MKVLVVGGGGREHAICWKLAQSPKVTELYCAPGNGGIAQVAQCVPIKATDVEGMVQWAKDNAMDFVMVAPDDPLALGMVDALEAAGIPAFGPWANAAIIEASKAFSKELMRKYHIPTAKYETFTDMDAALAYVRAEGAPIVVKADGLALGKGVVVASTVEEAETAVREMMEGHKFGVKTRKRGPRKTDEERLAEMEADIKKLKERIANKKIKDFEPICENLGKILIQMSGYDFAALPYDKKKACKNDTPTARAIVAEMAKAIAAQTEEPAEEKTAE